MKDSTVEVILRSLEAGELKLITGGTYSGGINPPPGDIDPTSCNER